MSYSPQQPRTLDLSPKAQVTGPHPATDLTTPSFPETNPKRKPRRVPLILLALASSALWFVTGSRASGAPPAPAQDLVAERDAARGERDRALKEIIALKKQLQKLDERLLETRDLADGALEKSTNAELEMLAYMGLTRGLLREKEALESTMRKLMTPPRVVTLTMDLPKQFSETERNQLRGAVVALLLRSGYRVTDQLPEPPEIGLLASYHVGEISSPVPGRTIFSLDSGCAGPGWYHGTTREVLYHVNRDVAAIFKGEDIHTELKKSLQDHTRQILDKLALGEREANFALASGNYDSVAEISDALRSLHRIHQPDNSSGAGLPDIILDSGFADTKPATAAGSGMLVSPKGLVATSAHLLNDQSLVDLWLHESREKVAALVVRIDKGSDIALLRILDVAQIPKVEIYPSFSESPLMEGGDIATVGFPGGTPSQKEPIFAAGKILRLGGTSKPDLFYHDAILLPGHAGSLLMDPQGKVLGVAHADTPLSMLLHPGSKGEGRSYPATSSARLIALAEEAGVKAELTLGKRGALSGELIGKLLVMVPRRDLVPSRVPGAPPQLHDFLYDYLQPQAGKK